MVQSIIDNFEIFSFTISILIVLSILASKISYRVGLPSLLLFLLIGMLSGSDGIGGIHFEDQKLSQIIGVISLIYILFDGGLQADWTSIRKIYIEALVLANIGVIITAVLMGIIASMLYNFSNMEALLLGAIVSSTDAASVFALLKSSGLRLKGNLKPLLEFESGSNDTVAVILTLGFINLILDSNKSVYELIPISILQIIIGGLFGFLAGKFILSVINKLNLEYDGLYTVFIIIIVYIIYVISKYIYGNGFLSVYIFGIVLGNSNFLHKKSIKLFMDGISWLLQILMFLTLGLLVFPSRLYPIYEMGILFAVFLIFFARPIAVFICLFPFQYTFKEKILVSWVGLRGAAPIVLATFPFTAGVSKSEEIFNIVFFVVLISLLLQGSTIRAMTKLLGLDIKEENTDSLRPELEIYNTNNTKLLDLFIPFNSSVENKYLVDLKLPVDCHITMICRGEEYIVPNGKSVLKGGDVLIVLAKNNSEIDLVNILSEIEK
jgi:potassium/hydrogen antiporter